MQFVLNELHESVNRCRQGGPAEESEQIERRAAEQGGADGGRKGAGDREEEERGEAQKVLRQAEDFWQGFLSKNNSVSRCLYAVL